MIENYNVNVFKDDVIPAPVVEEHEGFKVIRDDLLPYGAKSRYCDKFIKELPHKEIVAGGFNAYGWGAVSLAYLCKRHDKKCTLFYRRVNQPTIYQQKAQELGAEIKWFEKAMTRVTQGKARMYAEEDPINRYNIGFGLDHEDTRKELVRILKTLNLDPPEVWSVGSSGSLNRAMQEAFPNAAAHVVQTGHKMNEEEIGRAKLYISPYKYSEPVKKHEQPPFPSVAHYDSKAWSFMRQHAKRGALFYNVAGY